MPRPTAVLGLSTGQRVVTVQKGPLYRVRGSHITLWCKVSGYQGPAEQNFQWSIYLPSAPGREVQIVSTVDPSFPYAIYTQRVRSRGIYVERVQGDAVLLHITELQDRDAGEYECHTPNTDERYFGSYSAKTNLSVIADTLSASMAPQVLTHTEGDAVELTCKVSKSTAQHTHLSVGWYHLQEAGDRRAEEVLTLSKDFVLRPGPSYVQRFLAGDVRLNKVGNTTYKLSIGGVELSDRGQLYCEAAEWIEDPDETWKDISRKQTGRTSLAVMSQGRDLSMDITATESSLSEGDTLQLNCTVGAQKSSSRHFQVLWLLNGMEVARVEPHGILIWQEEYEERAKLGHLQAFKQSSTVYVLTIYEVGLKDNGTYHCSVSEVKTPGDIHSIQTKLSSGIQVNVKPIESHMHLSVSTSTPQVMAGDALVLLCEVQGATSPVSVQWWHLPPQHPGPRVLVATMERDGTLSLGDAYRDSGTRGSLRLEKASSGAFTLVIPNTLDEGDSGRYGCKVTEWSRGQSWTEEGETAVTVSSMGELGHPYFWAFKLVMLEARLEKRVDTCGLGLHATLTSRIATVRYGQSFELVCQVSASYTLEEVPASVGWLFQPSPPTGHYHELVRVFPSGTVAWGAAQPRFQGKAQLTKAATSFRLHIRNAAAADEGTYQCEVEVWRKNTLPLGRPAATTRSNAVGIKLVLPESKLRVAMKESSVETVSGANTAIECRIMFAQNNSQFAITWYLLPPPLADAPPLQILRADYSSILEYGAEFSSPAQKSRFLSQRVSSNVFWLRILSANPGDQGRYYCVVEEWLWLVDGWYKLGEGASGSTMLEFKLPGRELQLEKTNHSVSAREGEEVTLHCLLQGAHLPTTHLSATWFRGEESRHVRPLLTLRHDGAIEYPMESLARRLHLRRPTTGDFSLTLRSVEESDAGVYHCQVQEWQQQSKGTEWALQALARSGYTRLTTTPPESTVLSRICSSPPLLNFILYLPLVLILLLALVVFCLYFKFRKSKKGNVTGDQLMELQGAGGVKKT
ncbi:PREDICTED: immunoglobulin superfamily member 2 [Haliaeetus leucocephalus]|uniref:immunoglobulin superfamily member 2 n=1 Tax=Haliaeetus leucocephalus TaxID=52644 RepID=UPI00053CD362|nr:PREDICTED: immunoglobulin superfamily member 2 [Haliaeetus leucocephalus]